MAKVLVVANWYPNENNLVHGIFVKEFVKAKKLYNDVIVVHGELTSEKKPKFPYEIHDGLEDGIRTIRFIYKRRFLKFHRVINIVGWVHCLLKLSKEGYKPDIIHFHEYDASLPIFLYAKLHNIPLVITEHYSGFVTNILTFSQRIYASIVLKNSDAIFPVSKHLEKYLRVYAPKAKFDVVNNVVDTDLFKVPLLSKDASIAKRRLLVVARLEQNKGVNYLIESLSSLRKARDDFFLDIVGDGNMRESLESMVSELDLTEFVRFHGMLKKEQVAEYMSQCDFLILPSLSETFGCVLIEAMACGKPVVATNNSGPQEIVTPQTGILVEPANSEVLKDAIDYMLDNYCSYSANEISQYAFETFSLESAGKKLNEIYGKIMSGRQ